MVYYSYRILSGQSRHFLIGSSQTGSQFFLYCFMYLSMYFIFHHFHPSISSLFPYPSTPPKYLVSLTTALLAFVSASLPSFAFSHISSLTPSLVSSILTSTLEFVPSPSRWLCHPVLVPLYPLSPLSTLPSETILPPLLVILHPPLPLLLMRNHNLSPVAWTPIPQCGCLIGFGCGCSAGARLQVVSSYPRTAWAV